MKTKHALLASAVAGLLVMPVGILRAEVICRKARPIKPVHCVCGKLILLSERH